MTSISFLRVHLEEEPDSDVEDRENSPSRFFSTLPDLSEFLASREREERRREVRNRKKGSFGFTSVVRQCTNTCMGCMFSGGGATISACAMHDEAIVLIIAPLVNVHVYVHAPVSYGG